MDGHLLVLKLCGDGLVYPGHPLVLATIVMSIFPSYEEACAPTDHGWSAALADSRVPGAGDHVGAAMAVLRKGADGAAVDEMVLTARDYWDKGQAGGHVKNVPSGSHQAGVIEPHFRELAARWFPRAKAVAARPRIALHPEASAAAGGRTAQGRPLRNRRR